MSALRALPLVCVFATLFFLLWATIEEAKLRIAVENAQIQFEPGYVRLRIRVEPDPANRALAVGIVSESFETSSLEQLEGDRARITRWFEYKDVPAGEYWAVAEVYRPSAENWHARTKLTVLPRY